ncbi:hypothetical protein H9P43_001993 [Blastocladiella emersonii ATCC 22665]|nr:hypothetical protein H9P43_001993 [Blastocladiella emersonii ATCC 22665]
MSRSVSPSAAGSSMNLQAPTKSEQRKIEYDYALSGSMRALREDVEAKVQSQRKLKHFEQEQANIREASLTEARNLYTSQLTERRQTDLRQRELAEALLQSELNKLRLGKISDRWMYLKLRFVQLEEAREREVAHRRRMKQKREAFQMLISNLEARQVAEREDLKKGQERIANNLKLVQELEMRSLSESDRRVKVKANEVAAHQLRMQQQKEAEQLRELQLIKIKHMTETLQHEVDELNALEDMAQVHREEELTLEAKHEMELQAAQDQVNTDQALIKANHLRERQKQIRGQLESRQRRQARFLERQQRHTAKLRQRTFMAADELLAASSGANGDGDSDTSSDTGSDSESMTSGATSETEHDEANGAEGGEGQVVAAHGGGHGHGGGFDQGADRSKNLAEAQEQDILEQLRKGRERIKMLQRQQRENTESLLRQHRDQFRMLQKEHKRVTGDLIKEQEEETRQIKSDHAVEMSELLATMSRNEVIESQMDKQLDTDSSNGLLEQMLPKFVTAQLKEGKIPEPVSFDFVCVGFMDVYGFKELATKATGKGRKLVKLLDRLYKCFDTILERYPTLYKVETVLDTYMVATGVQEIREQTSPAERLEFAQTLLDFSLDAMTAVHDLAVHDLELDVDWSTIPLRVGLNCGPCFAGVVGNKMIHYCLFGDTINVASRMCSTSTPGKIQVSSGYRAAVAEVPDFAFIERGPIPIKGKGDMITHFVDFQVEPAGDGTSTPKTASRSELNLSGNSA